MQGYDLLVALSLRHLEGEGTLRAIASQLGMSLASIQRAIERLRRARLVDRHRRPNEPALAQFVLYGARYAFPVKLGSPTRGVPTAWSYGRASHDALSMIPVWPDPLGTTRGLEVKPLHPAVLDIAATFPLLGEELALLEVLRLSPLGSEPCDALGMLQERLKAVR